VELQRQVAPSWGVPAGVPLLELGECEAKEKPASPRAELTPTLAVCDCFR
jgi:hypothetical protein